MVLMGVYVFTRPFLTEGSSLQVEILFVCLSVCLFLRHHFDISNIFHFMKLYTIQTIYFLKAGDTHYLLTHCPLPHHPHRPTRPTKPTHNPYDMTIFNFMMLYTIRTIYFLKAGDTHYPLTHCPLHHHPHRPTIPTKPTHNPHNMTIFPFYDVLHYTCLLYTSPSPRD